MTPEAALTLAEAWAKHARSNLDKLEFSPDGSFHGDVGSAYLQYEAVAGGLAARGLVGQEGTRLLKHPQLFERLKAAGEQQKSRTAGGYFEVDVGAAEFGRDPTVNLRLDFEDGGMKASDFVDAVQELMDASTYWRLQGYLDVLVPPG